MKAILYLVTVFFWFAQSSYVSYISPALQGMGAGASLIGAIVGIYGFVQLATRIPLGIIADKRNLQKFFIIIGAGMAALGALGLYISFSPIGFLIFRAVAGGASSTWLCFTVTYASYYSEKESVNAMSIINSANYFGKLIGIIIAGLIASRFGVRSIFLAASIAGVLSFVLSFFVKKPELSNKNVSVKELLGVMKNKHLMMISFFSMAVQFVCYSATYGFASLVAKDIGATNGQLAITGLITTVFLFTVSVCSGKFLIRRLGVKKLLITGAAAMLIYCAGLGFVSSLSVLFILQGIAGIGEGLLFPILTGMCNAKTPPEKKTAGMGVYSAVYGLGMTIGPIITGSMLDLFSYRITFCLLALIPLLLIVLIIKKI